MAGVLSARVQVALSFKYAETWGPICVRGVFSSPLAPFWRFSELDRKASDVFTKKKARVSRDETQSSHVRAAGVEDCLVRGPEVFFKLPEGHSVVDRGFKPLNCSVESKPDNAF